MYGLRDGYVSCGRHVYVSGCRRWYRAGLYGVPNRVRRLGRSSQPGQAQPGHRARTPSQPNPSLQELLTKILKLTEMSRMDWKMSIIDCK